MQLNKSKFKNAKKFHTHLKSGIWGNLFEVLKLHPHLNLQNLLLRLTLEL